MSKLAWDILVLFIEQAQSLAKSRISMTGIRTEWERGYIAAWVLGEKLGGDSATIQAITTKTHPRNIYERALKELLDLGIVEEIDNLRERFQLVVKD